MSKRIAFMLIGLVVLVLSGCATIMDAPKGIAGISTKALEDSRKEAIAKAFDYDYNTCYNKSLEILSQIDAYIYAKVPKKNLIAFYVTAADTTPVGLFFTRIDANKTQVEISSMSTYARERLSKRIFAMLSGLPDPEEKKENENGEEENKNPQ